MDCDLITAPVEETDRRKIVSLCRRVPKTRDIADRTIKEVRETCLSAIDAMARPGADQDLRDAFLVIYGATLHVPVEINDCMNLVLRLGRLATLADPARPEKA